MLIYPKNRLYLKKKPDISANPTPPALELISAVYSINDASVLLTFNRSINADYIDTHAFKVYDGIYANQILDGATYSAYGSDGVIVSFDQLEAFSSATCVMNVTNPNGIKDAVTDEAWVGVSGYVLTIG